ncbi:hypothetical protein VTN00DRAFT_818 [Thermoascus crustaceus]|uniref:uncharacterized protein n=1 Tax=Thermoascus crustaceus TaxID=5088 RepID=UPI0037427A8A
MSLLRDPTIFHSRLHRKNTVQTQVEASPGSSRASSLAKRATVATLSSFVRDSVTWAGDVLNSYRDGLSKEEREKKAYVDERRQILYLRMRNAVSYEEWRSCASELDELEDNNSWKETFESDEYNPHLVQERLQQLEDARLSCDVSRMLFLIRTSLSRDLGRMSDASLYRHSHIGTKNLIDRYISTALDTISTLVELTGNNRCDGPEMKYILDQLLSARQAFGRSALLLSGGATFGMNHIGVLKALWEAKLLPRIISGASAGSIVCAVFCVHTDDELPDLLRTFAHGDFAVFEAEGQEENILQKAARFLKYGSFLDIWHLERALKGWLGDITFQEAYNRTRRILNICVSSASIYELPRILNYITAPNVLIRTAVAVSCSVPFLFNPAVLMAKDPVTGEAVPWSESHRQYIDGSVDGDLPMSRLSEMFNVNHFIVSQVNPHVVPFLPKDEGPGSEAAQSSRSRWLHTFTSLAREEALHRMTVLSELGIFPNSLTKAVSILSQRYSGDINIFPEIPYTNFPRMLKNPTTEFMLQACLSGERATWPRMGRIRNHCAIEIALDSAVQTMRARVALCPSQEGLRLNALMGQSGESFDSTRGRGRIPRRRRSSYSHESERLKTGRGQSNRRPVQQLRRSRSSVSFEHWQRGKLLNSTGTQDQEREGWTGSTQDVGQSGIVSFTIGADTDGEVDWTFPERPVPPRHGSSWGPSSSSSSSYANSSPCLEKQSRMRARRSSVGRETPPPTRPPGSSVRRHPSPTAQALLSSSHRSLKMTPSMAVSSSE